MLVQQFQQESIHLLMTELDRNVLYMKDEKYVAFKTLETRAVSSPEHWPMYRHLTAYSVTPRIVLLLSSLY
jgi:hypothetical protein